MFDVFQYPFIQRAFLIGTIAAVPFGLIGTFVVVRRIGYLAGAIAHCAFGGIGAGLYLQYLLAATVFAGIVSPMAVSLLLTVFAALLIGAIRIKVKEREDTLIGAVWAIGMALGMIFLSLTPGNTNISSYLFGDILLLSHSDVYLVAGVSAFVLVCIFFFFRRLEAVCFDAEFAQLRGIHTSLYFQLLLVLTALTVVLFVRVIGILLLIAMLTLPAAAACRFSRYFWGERLLPIACLAVVFAALASWVGLTLSICFNLPAGPMVVLTAAVIYFLSLIVKP
ncbi:putative metal transport system membrane protein [Planctomycetales bacterium]|nr:putative metal transport system membrane protein [Planctomycetales bacterium]